MDAKRSSFQKLVWEMGAVIDKALAAKGRRIFTIESVLNTAQPAELIAVFAGHIPDVHEKTLDKLYEQQVVAVPQPVDVAVYGVHPLILWGQGAFPLKHLGRAFLAGAEDPDAARRVGFEPFATVEEAVAEAEASLGKDCSIAHPSMPPMFLTSVGG